MKKQILILVFLVLAVFAGVNKSYGQCADDATKPVASKAYDYAVTVPVGWTAVTYQWFLTTDPNILVNSVLTNTGLIVPVASTFVVNSGGNWNSATNATGGTMNITWSPKFIADAIVAGALAIPTNYYLVVQYQGTNGGCTATNLKAYKIKPINSFNLALVNVDNAAATIAANFATCIVNPKTASITDNGTTATIVYDYGTDVLYAKVSARNFSGAFGLNLNYTALAALAGAGETFTLGYSNAINGTYTPISTDVTSIPEAVGHTFTAVQDVYLKLTFNHGTFEHTSAVTYGIDAKAIDASGNPSVDGTCIPVTLHVTPSITARPAIANAAVAPAIFIP